MLTKISLEHNLFPIRLNFPQNQNQNTTSAANNIPVVESTAPAAGMLKQFLLFSILMQELQNLIFRLKDQIALRTKF
jgi:hypothetical protein